MSTTAAIPLTTTDRLLRLFAGGMVAFMLAFLVNVYFTFWQEWPGVDALFAHLEWLGLGPRNAPLEGAALTRAWVQLGIYFAMIGAAAVWVLRTPNRPLAADADLYSAMAAYIVRGSFWTTVLVGLADATISFLRVEGLLEGIVGEDLTRELGRSLFRGGYVHLPLLVASFVLAFFVRGLGFIWLALLVVFAEFQIVISRFVYSYEQAYMGDLVRFWYAALFLLASAYTLVEDGHVRVDVFYARFSARGKAWSNAVGSVLLGYPLCWTIIALGMWGPGSSLIRPLVSVEISQSGFGMYTKYLMAAFLLIFAITMVMQFSSYLLYNSAILRGHVEPPPEHASGGH